MGLSRRAYAAHRKAKGLTGTTDTAVRKALKDGRIALEADGSIDPAKADAQWDRTTEAAKQRGADSVAKGIAKARETIAADEQKPMPPSAARAVNEGAEEAEAAFGSVPSYAKARAVNEAIKAQRSKLILQKMKGELVDRKMATLHVLDLARKERDHWLQLPARVAANLAAELEVDAHAMEMALDRVIRDHLALLSEIKIELAASEV